MKKTLIALIMSLIAGCTNQPNKQYQTKATQEQKACELLQQLPQDIRSLSMQLLDVEQKIANTNSNSDLLLNPAGWLNAVSTEDQLASTKSRISNELELKKKVYNVLLQSDSSRCQAQVADNTQKNYCGAIAIISKGIAIARDKGTPASEVKQQAPQITAKINEHMPLNQAMTLKTNSLIASITNVIYENPKITPETFQSHFLEKCINQEQR